MNRGIVVAGTVLVDKINEIAAYPQTGELTKILAVRRAVGGCVPNVAIDLKKIDPTLPVKASGKVGCDDEGRFLQSVLEENGVDITHLRVEEDHTSFTEVMSIVGGQRTFFTYAGVCADYGIADIDFDALDVDMLHLGYFLLLNRVDKGDGLKILKEAKKRGIKTSIDLVSENSDRYKIVLPCLPYTDNLIINEIEGANLAGMEPKAENLETIAKTLFSMGVKERVILHMKDRGVCYSQNGFTLLPAYDIPPSEIKGTTGAGDAFCAGALLGIYRNLSDEEILDLASACAIAALTETDATGGVRPEAEIRQLCNNYGRIKLCL